MSATESMDFLEVHFSVQKPKKIPRLLFTFSLEKEIKTF